MSALSGNPAINLYPQHDTNGGPAYLSDTNAAAAQFTKIYLNDQLILDYARKLKTFNPTESYTLPVFSDGTPQYTKFLFEGAGIGSCQLTLTISQTTGQGSNIIAQTSTWLDLHDVKDFYERVVITNITTGAISNWSSGIHSITHPSIADANETEDIIVFVHGFNNTEWNWQNNSDTIFKRLYWAGYNGRFASVRWPCKLFNLLLPSNFNYSELNSYKASTAMGDYLAQLHTQEPNLRLHILAHSQGNAISSEAMRDGAPFDTYILSQGAVAASAYDVNAPTNADLMYYEQYSHTPEWQPMGYHGAYTNITGRLVNFFNPEDYALGTWITDQKLLKPNTGYAFDGTNGLVGLPPTIVTDPQESRAMIARSRTLPIGQSGPASGHGVIESAVDLQTQLGFGDTSSEHSAQWNRPIQTGWNYFDEVLGACLIPTIPRQ
jgi:pimeloyl-ACP methyl ester carboxylesterase